MAAADDGTAFASADEAGRQLSLLLSAVENLQQLKENGDSITYREVAQLRRAYTKMVGRKVRDAGESTLTEHPSAVGCNALLTGLEKYIAAIPEAHTYAEVGTTRLSFSNFLRVPLRRRLQTMMVSVVLFFTGVPICMSLAVLLLCFVYTAPLIIMYLIYIWFFDTCKHPLPRRNGFVGASLWKYYRDYFPVRLVVPERVSQQLDAARNYLFVYHPHGIHSFGVLLNFALDTNNCSAALPGIRTHVQTLKINFQLPFWREITKAMGSGDASSKCIRNTLRAGPGESVVLVVGGAEEALLARPHTNDSLVLRRKGFVKIALQEGSPLVPIYAFGENNTYDVLKTADSPRFMAITHMVKRLTGFTTPLVKGRGFFNFGYGVIPHRVPIVVVVGPPVEVPRISDPTAEDLEHWHQVYVAALQSLYKEYAAIYDSDGSNLRLVS